jgi:hypothetical protein
MLSALSRKSRGQIARSAQEPEPKSSRIAIVMKWSLLLQTLRPAKLVMLTAAFVSLGVWSVVSPVGSDPDGSFHLNSIWCGQGVRPGICERPVTTGDQPEPGTVLTPLAVNSAGQCFAYRSFDSALCENATLNNREMVANQVNNAERLYPNGYYWVASHLVGQNVVLSAVLIRFLNISALLGLLILLWVCAESSIAKSATGSIFLLWVPLGMFTVASNNGSSWTLTGVALFWAFFWTFLLSRQRLATSLALCGLLLSASMALASRADGSMFVVLSAIVVLFTVWSSIATRRRRSLGLGLTLALGAVVGLMHFSSSQGQSLGSGLMAGKNFDRSISTVMWTNILRLPGFFVGNFGVGGYGSGLGWLDTPIEPLTWVSMTVVLVILLARSTGMFSMRHRFGAAIFCFALFSLPLYMYLLDRSIVGENVQIRYMLPLMTVALAFLFIPVFRAFGGWPLASSARVVLTSLVAIAHSAALHTNMRRYITGLDVVGIDLGTGSEWWPEWLPNPTLCWIVGSVSFGVAFFYFFKLASVPKNRGLSPDLDTQSRQSRLYG